MLLTVILCVANGDPRCRSVLYETVAGQTNALGEPYIYSVLDWSQPQTAALYSVLVCLITTPAFWLLLFALYKLRLALHRTVGHTQVMPRTDSDDGHDMWHVHRSTQVGIPQGE